MPKCERCATEVQLIDMNAIVDMVQGDGAPSTAIYFGDPTRGLTWYERYSSTRVGDKLTTLMIEHCKHRCDAARSSLLRNKEQTASPVEPC